MSYGGSKRRTVISDAAVPFVARGGRIFPRQVIYYDPGIAEGEEVVVVDRKNNSLSIAQAFITP